jgi:hypothetical protein
MFYKYFIYVYIIIYKHVFYIFYIYFWSLEPRLKNKTSCQFSDFLYIRAYCQGSIVRPIKLPINHLWCLLC